MKQFIRKNAKAIAAFVGTATLFVLTDGQDASELEETAMTLANAFIVWLIPNKGAQVG